MKKHKEAEITSHFASEAHARSYEGALGEALRGIDPDIVGMPGVEKTGHAHKGKKHSVWDV